MEQEQETTKKARNWKTRLRAAVAEHMDSQVLQLKFIAAAAEKVGSFIPCIGPLKAKAITFLADTAGDELDKLSQKIRGGYEIKGLPFATRDLTEKVNNFRESLTAARMTGLISQANKIGDAIKMPAPVSA